MHTFSEVIVLKKKGLTLILLRLSIELIYSFLTEIDFSYPLLYSIQVAGLGLAPFTTIGEANLNPAPYSMKKKFPKIAI